MANNVVHFEIYVFDPERAKKFYSEVLVWAFNFMKEMNYTLVYPGGEALEGPAKIGINGGRIDMPADTIPGIGRLAYIHDTEFNMIGLLQPVMQLDCCF